ncbi:hypothetical protein FALCPG4_014778 [Fusarium falciforme]
MVNKNIIESLFNRILEVADIVYATPAQSCRKFYGEWKNTKAKGFAIDEAANMTRPDLCSLWGNSMMPCILAGDEKQLPPAVITLDEKDGQGNAINRLGRDAKISPLEFFMGRGMPVCRLWTQLRMAKGLFDLSKRFAYPDANCTYGPGCRIELETHRAGRDLEAFAFVKYPELDAAPTGSLQPSLSTARIRIAISAPLQSPRVTEIKSLSRWTSFWISSRALLAEFIPPRLPL